MPDEPEAHGLLALMLCHDARRSSRFAGGELVLLADQDRGLWDFAQIAEGRAVLERALALRGRGPYVLQAAIASLQTESPVDWPQVVALYDELAALTRSPVVELNRAVAIAEAGDVRGRARDRRRAARSTDYRYLHSTRAELLRRLGRGEEARAAYERALELGGTEPERRFLNASCRADKPHLSGACPPLGAFWRVRTHRAARIDRPRRNVPKRGLSPFRVPGSSQGRPSGLWGAGPMLGSCLSSPLLPDSRPGARSRPRRRLTSRSSSPCTTRPPVSSRASAACIASSPTASRSAGGS